MKKRFLLCITWLGLLVLPIFLPAQSKIYWADDSFQKIQRANLDGSKVEDVIAPSVIWPKNIQLDVAGGKFYWTDYDAIKRANLDGTNVEELVSGLEDPVGLALDLQGEKMYWTDGYVGSIHRANLDGSAVGTIIKFLNAPYGIALDIKGGKIYWTHSGLFTGDLISRANLDGSEEESLLSGLENPECIALDLSAGKMYWTEEDALKQANLDGTMMKKLAGNASSDIHGIALDIPGGKMYWADNNKINCANLDGAEEEELITGITDPTCVAVDPVNGNMYWINDDMIRRASMDGSNLEDLLVYYGDMPKWLEAADGKIYWSDFLDYHIYRANLDGTARESLNLSGTFMAVDSINKKLYTTHIDPGKIECANLDGFGAKTLINGLSDPTGIVLDLTEEKMYWAEKNNGKGKIKRANLDGSEIVDLITTGLISPSGIEIDISANKIYWTDENAHKIQRANLDGSDVEDLVTEAGIPFDITLDLKNGKIYWSDLESEVILRADLDGSDMETLSIDETISPYGISIAFEGIVATANPAGKSSKLIHAVVPNPTWGKTSIRLNESIWGETAAEVVDILGRRMDLKIQKEIRELHFDCSDLLPGMYYFRLQGGVRVEAVPFVVGR